MHKFMIIFNHPEDEASFENTYNDLLALVERMPYIIRRQVIHVTGSPLGASRIHRILEVYYDNQLDLEESLRTERGQEAGRELQRFGPGSFELVFAQVYEEAGGQTSTKEQES